MNNAWGPPRPRLALGTVQFGLAYGARGPAEPVGIDAARTILSRAAALGIDMLDTAPGYGNAEAVIAAARPAGTRLAIVSKLARLAGEDGIGTAEIAAACASVDASLQRLGVDFLHALLIHHAPDLLRPGAEALVSALQALVAAGKIGRIGVSVYDSQTLAQALSRHSALTAVQFPLNLLDQRFAAGSTLARLAASGVELHVRSAFLQGVILQPPGDLRPGLADLAPALYAVREAAASAGLTPAALALGFLQRVPGIARVVVGVDSAADLDGIAAAWDAAALLESFPDCRALAVAEPRLIDPRMWS